MSLLLKVLVSAVLLAIICFQVDWHDVLAAFWTIDWEWLLVAFLAFNLATVFSARRWQFLLAAIGAMGARIGTRPAVATTYVSLWFSNFLPTAFGGDIARVLTARRAGMHFPVAVSCALIDRLLGLVTFVALFFFVEAGLSLAGFEGPMLPLASILFLGFVAAYFVVWVGTRVRVPRRWLRYRFTRYLARAVRVVASLGTRPTCLQGALVASMLSTMMSIVAYWGAIRCVSAGVGISVAVTASVLGILASALPVSLSGWGVREGTVAMVLMQSGFLAPGEASLIALLNATVIAATSLVGLVVSIVVDWRRSDVMPNGAHGT
ncbi:MAG: flippase-like domain-containing protein [Burkholderiales bacterium]|nr:flippase-like domain-containing protein [Burkholderiales bacterium]